MDSLSWVDWLRNINEETFKRILEKKLDIGKQKEQEVDYLPMQVLSSQMET